MNMICRCGPRSRSPISVTDARPYRARRAGPSADPTGTLPIQGRFNRDLDRRWNQLRKLIPVAIARVTDPVGVIAHSQLTGDDPVRAFQSWIDEAMRQLILGINGTWTLAYVRGAGDIALQRASSMTSDAARVSDRVPALQTLCVIELQGIMEAVSQQAVRAFANGLLTRQSVSSIARDIANVIDATGKKRSRLLVSFICVRTHSAVTLDAFRAAGVQLVGTVAERARANKPPPVPVVLARDAKKSKKSPLSGFAGLEIVEVLTAGDDNVCPVCEDISDEGPYDLDDAEELIPAHPNCRCAFVPADDARFASVHDEFDPDQPRDEDGKWTEGALPSSYSGTDAHPQLRLNVVDNPLPRSKLSVKDIRDFPEDMFRHGEPRELPIDSVKTTQDYINTAQVAEYAKPKNKQSFGLTINPIAVVRVGNETVLIDGTHRLALAKISGEKNVRVTDFGKFKKVDGKWTRDTTHDAGDWDEELHPRDKDGKFTESGGHDINTPLGNFKQSLEEHGVKFSQGTGNSHSDYIDVEPAHAMSAQEIAKYHPHVTTLSPETYAVAKNAAPKSSFDPEPKAHIDMQDLKKVSGKMGSNEGGVYQSPFGDKYYVKTPPSEDHVRNELIAAKLYHLAGSNTLNYMPVKGGQHVATELEALAKNNISQFSSVDRQMAQKDFAVHAWLANWDAAGTGGDNQGMRGNGQIVTLDTGGSLKYRAQGGAKGESFGNTVTETNTLRDPGKNHDAAKLFGDMTNDQMVESINRVTSIPDIDIRNTVLNNGGDKELSHKLIARKNDLAAQAAKMGTFGELGKTAPAQPASTAPDPHALVKEHVKFVKGTSAERVAMRKQLQSATDPELQKQLKSRILASFLKQHDASSTDKKAELAAKLGQYAQKYKMANPLHEVKKVGVQQQEVKAVHQPSAPWTPPPVAPPAISHKLPPGYANFSQSEKEGFDDLVQLYAEKAKAHGEKGTYKGGGPAGLVEVATTRIKDVEGHTGLTPVEAAHIIAYSGSQYRETNSALRSGVASEAVYKHVNALDDALDKLPSYEGKTVWRKTDLTAMIAAKYQEGQVVTEWGFTSTAKKKGVWSGDYHFTIHTRPGGRGKDIVKLSSHGDSEAEVLYKSGTRFKILKRNGNNIEMQELK